MKAMALVVLFLAVGAVGCDETPLSPSEIVDITWRLESVSRVGSPLVNVPNPDQYTVRFETNNRAAIQADCNSCSGSYTLDDSALSFGPLACTRVACPVPGLDTHLHRGAGERHQGCRLRGSDGHDGHGLHLEVPELAQSPTAHRSFADFTAGRRPAFGRPEPWTA